MFFGCLCLGEAFSSLSANEKSCVPVLLKYWHETFGACWLWGGLGLSVEMGGLWESSHRVMFHEVGSALVVPSPRLRSPTSGAQA